MERVEDPVTEDVTQLVVVHPTVESKGGDDVHVVDTGFGGHVEHRLDDALPRIGTSHLRQRQARVIEADREAHPCVEEGGKRLHVEGLEEGLSDGRVGIDEAGKWLGWVDHPRSVGWETFEAEPLSVPEQHGRRRTVDVEDESGSWHQLPLLRSKAILTAPRRPASAAWARAST